MNVKYNLLFQNNLIQSFVIPLLNFPQHQNNNDTSFKSKYEIAYINKWYDLIVILYKRWVYFE